MKTMFNLLRLDARLYLKSGKFILPLLGVVAFVATFYAIGPVDVVGSYAVSMAVMFFLLLWLGVGYAQAEEPVVVQLTCLKAQSAVMVYAAQAIWLLLISAGMSLIAVLYPVALHLGTGGRFFTGGIAPSDVSTAFFLTLCAAFMGASVGALFHPRLFPDRKLAYVLAMLVGLLGLVSGFFVEKWSALGGVSWLLPPIYDGLRALSGTARFEASLAGLLLARMGIYALAATVARIFLLKRIKF